MRLLSRVLALLIVGLVFCAPLFRGLQSVDQENDEAIYSYAAESIVETGDWMNPRSSPSPDRVFLEKPPLKFWIVALPIRLGMLPDSDFGLRFWDPVLGGLAFLYVFAFGRRLAGWSCGAAAIVILYTFNDLIFVHGLRGNNMEAALVLAYAGGIYHYLRWTETEGRGTARAHAAAVGFYFFLAFMTKFVAAAFMPAVVLAASAEVATVRAKVIREWRTWLGVGAGVVLLAAPWFVYQSLQPGHAVWSIMFGEHVFRRFRAWLDPAHLHPWYYYFKYLSGGLVENGTIWAVVAGAALIHVRVVRERWLAGTLVLYWFWLPFVVMSLGSSKLWHYAYPFLAPVALAAGYAVGATADAAARGIAKLSQPAGVARRSPIAGVRARLGSAWPWLERVLIAAAGVLLIVAAVGLLYPNRLENLGVTAGTQLSLRSALAALLLGILADKGPRFARLAVPLMLLAFMPVQDYAAVVRRTADEQHPLRSTSECAVQVRRAEQAAGRPAPDIRVFVPNDTFGHPLFFYYRKLGWDERPDLTDADLTKMLDDPAEQRPIVMPSRHWERFLERLGRTGTMPPSVRVSGRATVVLPGPYSSCAVAGNGKQEPRQQAGRDAQADEGRGATK